jgi:hypothetical protein
LELLPITRIAQDDASHRRGNPTSPRWGEVKQAMQARAITGRGLFRRRVLPERRAARKPLVKNLRLKL